MTEEVSIPPKYYNSIIGSGGKLVKHIMDECGGVQIKFPNADSKSDKVIKYLTISVYGQRTCSAVQKSGQCLKQYECEEW